MKTADKGFTLVELAIVMTIIGLLIGGVLKGQELLENARVTSTVSQVKSYDAATFTFLDAYGALPGDITNPAERLANCITDICNIGGNGNGKIANDDTTPAYIELYNFFVHLDKAGMIKGVDGGDTTAFNGPNHMENFFPATPLGYRIGVQDWVDDRFYNGSLITGSSEPHRVYAIPALGKLSYSDQPMLPVKIMRQFDTKMDDGKPHSGSVQVSIYNDCPTVGYMNGTDENEYAQTDAGNTGGCPIIIKTAF